MKRLLLLIVLFFVAVGWLVIQENDSDTSFVIPLPVASSSATSSSNQASDTTEQSNTALHGAVWIATAYNIDYPTAPTTDVHSLKQQCKTILDTVVSAGLDTVYLQVRPSCDAFYPSQYFPWSSTLTGTVGQAPENHFDPLAYWIKESHKRDLRLEAWINPYRICAGSEANKQFSSLPDSSPAVQHPEWVIEYNGEYYFDPGIPEVRQLIVDGVTEIVESYAVDGIQFDDYFYPGDEFDDDASYQTYASPNTSRADWRRNNVNQLIQAVYHTVHQNAKQEDCVFGVSPSGIWKNGSGDEDGSDTRGFEHYSQSYADSITWIQNGWIDYLCPQIYWEIGNDAADFETLVHWWSDRIRGTDVSLVIGLAAYKIGSIAYGTTWKNNGIAELLREVKLCQNNDSIHGIAVFSYHNLSEHQSLCKKLHSRLTK